MIQNFPFNSNKPSQTVTMAVVVEKMSKCWSHYRGKSILKKTKRRKKKEKNEKII